MSLEDDVANFSKWATNLGFPLEELPHEDAIKSIFKSRQQELYNSLMEKVLPSGEVAKIRRNILLQKMGKVDGQMVSTLHARNFLPKEMQRFLKIEDLKKKKAKLEAQTTEYAAEYESLINSIQFKNMQVMKLKHKRDNLATKANILEMKRDDLDENLAGERETKEKILAAMPVKVRSSNVNESNALRVVLEALKELDDFYNVCLNNSNPQSVQEAKDEMWKKLHVLFRDLPNVLIFNTITKLKEEQLQNIISLNKDSLDSTNVTVAGNNSVVSFNKALLKAKSSILETIASCVAAKRERENLNQKFAALYQQFVEDVQKKVSLCSKEVGEDVDEIISDYIVQFNTRSFNKGQNDFLVGEIEKCKAQIEQNAKVLDDHTALLGSIRQMYTDIETTVNRVQCETMQLNQVREKILYSIKLVQHMGDTASSQHKFASSQVRNNSGGDIFDMTDTVFSSTKVDFDASMNATLTRGDMTFMPQAKNWMVPLTGEISTFMQTPMERFNNFIKENNSNAFYLHPNPLIIESQELSSTIKLAPGLLLTAQGALQEVINSSLWAEQIATVSAPLTSSIEVVSVDRADFRHKIKQQHEEITESLDHIDVVGISTSRTLKKADRYYNFALANPLRHYIPPSVLFNNQAYSEYESEYMMFYRMANVGGSVK